jgi:transketolase
VTSTFAPVAEPAVAPARYEDALLRLCLERPELVVLTAENRAAIRSLPARLGGRFLDVGIAEQTMVGMAAGLALRGRRPVVHALSTFLTLRAFEFIRTDVGLPRLPVVLVGGVPGVLSEANGPTHQALDDLAVMRAIPGMQVVCPADEDELAAALTHVLDSGRPTYVRHVSGPARVTHLEPFRLGRAEVLAEGRDVALLVHGPLLASAAGAAERLRAWGASVRLVNVRSLVPLDEAALLAAAGECRLLVTIEDHFTRGGLYTALAELLTGAGLACRVLNLGLETFFRPALLPDVLRVHRLTPEAIAARVRTALEHPATHPREPR